MPNDIHANADARMKKSVAVLKSDFIKIRTGRAHPSLLDHIMVSYYGNDTPLSQVASVTVSDPRTLTVSPWEKTMVQAVEKAIMNADLGLNPVTSGVVIRVPLPPLTEERRKEMTRIVRNEAETAKVAIRNIRRDANNAVKDLVKDKAISDDEQHRSEERIQKLTDSFIAEVDTLLKAKEADVMEI